MLGLRSGYWEYHGNLTKNALGAPALAATPLSSPRISLTLRLHLDPGKASSACAPAAAAAAAFCPLNLSPLYVSPLKPVYTLKPLALAKLHQPPVPGGRALAPNRRRCCRHPTPTVGAEPY